MRRGRLVAAARAVLIGSGLLLAGTTASARAALPNRGGGAPPLRRLEGRYIQVGTPHRVDVQSLTRVAPVGRRPAPAFRPREEQVFQREKEAAAQGLTGRRRGVAGMPLRGGQTGGPSRGTTAAPAAGDLATAPPPASSSAFSLMNLDQQMATFGTSEELTPPDTQLAAGPTDLLEMDNAVGSVWSKAGAPVDSFDLNAFFGVPSADAGYGAFDVRVLYDAASGRWLASTAAANPNLEDDQVFLAVSQTSDPTGAWSVYTVAANTAGTLYDQPKLGVSGDKVVLSWNDFSYGGRFFSGQETWILQKSALLSGGVAPAYQWGPDTSRFSVVPAQVLGSADTEYLVYDNADASTLVQNTSHPSAGVVVVTGTPAQGDVALTEYDPQIAATSAPPNAAQPNGGPTIATDDDRFLSAVWQNGVLWTAGNDACVPPGDTATRSCLRLVEVTTAGTPAVAQDFDAASVGADLYYPAVGLDGSGNLFVAFSASSASLFASAMASAQPAAGPVGSLGSPVAVQAGQAVYCGFDCQSGGGNRWGDYSAVAADPSTGGLVWTTAEYADTASDQGNWGTATAALSLAPAPSRLAFTTTAQTATAGAAADTGPVTVQLQSASGAAIAATADTTVDLGSSSASTVFAAAYGGAAVTSITIPAGASSASLYFGDTRAGTPTLTASGGSLAPAGQTETVVAGPASQLAVGAPASATTGSPVSVAVTAEDAYGNVAASYGGTVHFTSTDPAALLPANYTFSSVDAGGHSFSVTFGSTGSETVTATDTADAAITGTSGPVAVAAPLTITTTSAPAGTVGTSYATTLSATGGTTPYTWSITAGSLPAGLSLDPSTGTISGTPTTAATSSFSVEATDAVGRTARQTLSLTVDPAPLAITTASLPGGTVGTTYSATLSATGGTTPYTWSLAGGSLPAGLSLDPSTGTISGTPTTAATSSFSVEAADSSSPRQTATRALSITVSAEPLAITTTSLPGGTVGTTYSVTLSATGGTNPYTWSPAGGSLPAGLSLDPSTGTISGTPTTAATSSFSVEATDSSSPRQTATRALSITVSAAPLAITTTSLPNAVWHQAYSAGLQASGGTGSYSWSLAGGSLPPGLSLGSGGTISGTCKHWGTWAFTVQVADGAGQTADQNLSIAVSK